MAGGLQLSLPQLETLQVVIAYLHNVRVMALLAQFGITKAFTTGNAAKVSVVNLTQVVFAMTFDIFCFGHPIDLVRFLGMSLILVPATWLMMERARAPTDGKPDRMGAKHPSNNGENDDEARC